MCKTLSLDVVAFCCMSTTTNRSRHVLSQLNVGSMNIEHPLISCFKNTFSVSYILHLHLLTFSFILCMLVSDK